MNSPPVGVGATPPSLPGICTMPVGKPAFPALLICQVPFSAKANSPVRNSSHVVFWELLMTELGAVPSLTHDVHRASASTAWGESSWVSCAPAPQNHGRNWNDPSSVPMAENVIGFL